MSWKGEITIQSFNPYEVQFPGRRIISRDTLLLMKMLRQEGYQVTIVPDNGSRVYQLRRKGVTELFADPVLVYLLDIPLKFIIGVIAGLTVRRLLSGSESKGGQVHLLLESEQDGKKMRFDYKGRPLADTEFQSIIAAFKTQQQSFGESFRVTSPDPARPKPIFLEHTPRIVGWGRVFLDKSGKLMVDAKGTDDETWEKTRNGVIKVFSWGGLVGQTVCSICQEEYLDCNHVAGKKYKGKECVVRLEQVEMAEISLVSDPVMVDIGLPQEVRNKS
jgi:hypothetical protein